MNDKAHAVERQAKNFRWSRIERLEDRIMLSANADDLGIAIGVVGDYQDLMENAAQARQEYVQVASVDMVSAVVHGQRPASGDMNGSEPSVSKEVTLRDLAQQDLLPPEFAAAEANGIAIPDAGPQDEVATTEHANTPRTTPNAMLPLAFDMGEAANGSNMDKAIISVSTSDSTYLTPLQLADIDRTPLGESSRTVESYTPGNNQDPADDVAEYGFVDIDCLDAKALAQSRSTEQLRVEGQVSDLMRELHTPPTRTNESPKIDSSDSEQASAVQGLAAEGGMVLLRAAQTANDGELFLIDEAFAEMSDLFDMSVRMEPAIGAYQAFDVGVHVGGKATEARRPTGKSSVGRSVEESASKQSTQTSDMTTRAATGMLASAAAMVSLRRVARGKKER